MFHFMNLRNATPNDIVCYNQPIYPHRWYFSMRTKYLYMSFFTSAIKDVECFIADIGVISFTITVCTPTVNRKKHRWCRCSTVNMLFKDNFMSIMASQTTDNWNVCPTAFGDDYKNISLDYWFFVLCEEVHGWSVVSSHKRQVMWNEFPRYGVSWWNVFRTQHCWMATDVLVCWKMPSAVGWFSTLIRQYRRNHRRASETGAMIAVSEKHIHLVPRSSVTCHISIVLNIKE